MKKINVDKIKLNFDNLPWSNPFQRLNEMGNGIVSSLNCVEGNKALAYDLIQIFRYRSNL